MVVELFELKKTHNKSFVEIGHILGIKPDHAFDLYFDVVDAKVADLLQEYDRSTEYFLER